MYSKVNVPMLATVPVVVILYVMLLGKVSAKYQLLDIYKHVEYWDI